MQPKDFNVFCTLLSDVHSKAFGEPLAPIPHGKAQTLSWFIEESTGIMLSYKSLKNYIHAALTQAPENINPNGATLSALACFVTGEKTDIALPGPWFRYRAGRLSLADGCRN